MENKTVMVLGTEYTIKFGTYEEYAELSEMDGFTDTSIHTIVVDDMSNVKGEVGCKVNLIEYRNSVVRHELIHAFLHESGLANNTLSHDNWSVNEEMVDWFAIQFPKILEAFKKVGCI